jgi:integration host factor subunit alpha
MTLTKKRIIRSIQNHCGYSKKRSIKLVESLVEIIKSTLESGEDVLITGFGKFCIKDKRERRGRNPASGDRMMLRSRKVVTFRYSSVLRKKIKAER